MLNDQLGVIEGSIALAGYAHRIVPDWRVDPDFRLFGAIDRPKVREACTNLIARFGSGKPAGLHRVTLYRPVGPKELELIGASGWSGFPPRLPGQPIFYPVTNEAYAVQIARDWNVKESGAGFVTRFQIDADFLGRYKVQQVGAVIHTEYWIPAEDLDEFNRHLLGKIEVTAEFR